MPTRCLYQYKSVSQIQFFNYLILKLSDTKIFKIKELEYVIVSEL